VNRRWFLNLFTTLVLGITGLLVAIPAFAYLWSPLRRKRGAKDARGAFVDVGPLSAIAPGEWRLLSVDVVHEDGWEKTRTRHGIWVRLAAGESDQISVLSSICPHLGCPINWHPDQSQFICPCHRGMFDASGKHVGGAPPRGMDPLDFEVRDGRLFVRWQDFKIGVAERIPVSV
jgi:menaquinol-cytochrome c reductase iron-sulfur subunit